MMKTKNLQGWWPLEGDGKDYGGANNFLVLDNVQFSDGKMGRCASIPSIVNSMYTSLSIPATQKLTICCWIKVTNLTESIILEESIDFNLNNAFCIGCNNTPGTFNAAIHSKTKGYRFLRTIKVFPLNTFNFVTCLVDTSLPKSQQLRLYVNAVQEPCVPFYSKTSYDNDLTGTIFDSNRVYFMRRYNLSTMYTTGSIDDIMIFTSVLTDSDIKRVYMGLHPLG